MVTVVLPCRSLSPVLSGGYLLFALLPFGPQLPRASTAASTASRSPPLQARSPPTWSAVPDSSSARPVCKPSSSLTGLSSARPYHVQDLSSSPAGLFLCTNLTDPWFDSRLEQSQSFLFLSETDRWSPPVSLTGDQLSASRSCQRPVSDLGPPVSVRG
jgi:hypothetical protein